MQKKSQKEIDRTLKYIFKNKTEIMEKTKVRTEITETIKVNNNHLFREKNSIIALIEQLMKVASTENH